MTSNFHADADATRARTAVVAETDCDLQPISAAEAGVRLGFELAPHMCGRSDTGVAGREQRRHKRTAGTAHVSRHMVWARGVE